MSSQVEAVGRELTRDGLVVAVAWIGLMNFTTYEAEASVRRQQPADQLGVRTHKCTRLPGILGVVEVNITLLIAARLFSPQVSAFGSALAVGDVPHDPELPRHDARRLRAESRGLPALSAVPGQFLINDLALLGISLWTLGEAWQVSEQSG